MQGFLVSGLRRAVPRRLRAAGRTGCRPGQLKYREDVARGIEAAPQAFIGMLQGKNQGKQLVQLSEL